MPELAEIRSIRREKAGKERAEAAVHMSGSCSLSIWASVAGPSAAQPSSAY